MTIDVPEFVLDDVELLFGDRDNNRIAMSLDQNVRLYEWVAGVAVELGIVCKFGYRFNRLVAPNEYPRHADTGKITHVIMLTEITPERGGALSVYDELITVYDTLPVGGVVSIPGGTDHAIAEWKDAKTPRDTLVVGVWE